MGNTLIGTLFDGDWEGYNKNGILPNIWKGILGKNEDERMTSETNEANIQMNSDNNAMNREIAEMNNLANKEITRLTNLNNYYMNKESNQANIDIANSTNAINKQIADENLTYQRELQEYNKALQEKLFEREDTSYQRTARDMIAAGLNPLSMSALNGSGSVVSQSALNNGFQAQMPYAQTASTDIAPTFERAQMQAGHKEKGSVNSFQSLMALASSMSSVMNAFDGVYTGQLQRDSLALENDKKFLDNFEQAQKIGLNYNGHFANRKDRYFFGDNLSNPNSPHYNPNYEAGMGSAFADSANKNREYNNKVSKGLFDSDMPFERAVTRIEKLLDNPDDLNRRLGNLGKNALSFLGGLFSNIKF